MTDVEIAPARVQDAEGIAELLARNRDVETLLLQPIELVRAHIDEFVVARGADGLCGCAQLHGHRPSIFELMSVAVDPSAHGHGIGSACVRACVARGLQRDATLIWLATTSPAFFAKLGFERISMWKIPLGILLGKVGVVVRQPLRRWPAAVLGRQVFMRWP